MKRERLAEGTETWRAIYKWCCALQSQRLSFSCRTVPSAPLLIKKKNLKKQPKTQWRGHILYVCVWEGVISLDLQKIN